MCMCVYICMCIWYLVMTLVKDGQNFTEKNLSFVGRPQVDLFKWKDVL